MGIYLNPGNEAFFNAVHYSQIYVDKTGLIAYTNSMLYGEHKNICVSRPRRFGKSMAANMLSAYYSRGCSSRELFQNLRIAQDASFEEHLNRYNVIHVNMTSFFDKGKTMAESLDYLQRRLLHELKREFGDVDCFDWTDLSSVCEEIYAEKKIPFVFIIDEWDCIFRVHQSSKEAQREYLNFLRNLLKDKPHVILAYMTGILPIKKYGEHSALNMFDEYSMTNQRNLSEFTGFTEEEVQDLCQKYDMSYTETKKWYDGYNLKGLSVYNPRSVVMSMTGHDFDNYWTKTETYEALKKYIQMDQFGLKQCATKLIAGEHLTINPEKFQNDMVTFNSADDVLTLLIHLGYLTYDFYTKTVWIPNSEVQQEFINSIEDGGWEPVMRAIRQSEALLEATLNGEAEKVAASIEKIHEENAAALKYNDENSLSSVLTLAYYSARRNYDIYRELQGGKGFADLVFLPRRNCSNPPMVMELKWNQNANSAIRQIHEKRYVESLKSYVGDVILVGICYEKDSKHHTCSIEKVKKAK